MINELSALPGVEVEGAMLACRDQGEGSPIVLVHGGVSDLRTWDGLADALTGYRTIAYSRRFACPNLPIPGDADDPIAQHVADLSALIEAKGVAPVHVVGHSWGACVALLTVIARPDLIRSLVLIEPPAVTLWVDLPPKPLQLLRLLVRRPSTAMAIFKLGAGALEPAEKAFRRGDDEAAIRHFGHGVLGKARFAALTPERYAQVWENRAPDRAQMLGAGMPRLEENAVRNIKVPVLLINGNESPAVFRHVNARLAELLPDARSEEIAGASHIVHEDAQEAVVSEIGRFLKNA